MATWVRRATTCTGAVLLRGAFPPRLLDLPSLGEAGLVVSPLPAGEDQRWQASLRHPIWGEATLGAPIERSDLPDVLVEYDPDLGPEEKALLRETKFELILSSAPATGNVLRDRKHLLRFLRAALGDDGLAILDCSAERFWSRRALDEELAHDADLDIQSLFALHVVHKTGEDRAYWVHSHGLAELGISELDLLDPHQDLTGRGFDLLRALAFAQLEGRLVPGGEAMALALPGGELRLVDASDFQARSDPGRHATWRADVDDYHLKNHAVVCDPQRAGWLDRLLRRSRPSANRFLSAALPDDFIVHFSDSATELMAERARGTFQVFAAFFEEAGSLGLPALVKLGYPTDAGAPCSREHLWFEVHACREQQVDATLVNQPCYIADLQQGQRGDHPLELLTDWTVFTPLGSVTPRHMLAMSQVRAHRQEIAEAMQAYLADGPAREG